MLQEPHKLQHAVSLYSLKSFGFTVWPSETLTQTPTCVAIRVTTSVQPADAQWQLPEDMRRAGIRRVPMDRSYTARLEEARLVMLDVAGRAMDAAAVAPEEAGSPYHAGPELNQ